MRVVAFFGFLLFCLPVFASGPIISVKYIHEAIADKYGVLVPYNAALENPRAAANMKYLLGCVDATNKMLGSVETKYLDTEYATSYACNKVVADKAISDLIHRKYTDKTVAETEEITSMTISIGAVGNFTINWGDGTVQTIKQTSANATKYTHNYAEKGSYGIEVGGLATKYSTSSSVAAISFSTNGCPLKSISGTLGAVFPTLSDGTQPRFVNTFYNCDKLAYLPANLFTGISGTGVSSMFSGTFRGCTSLKRLPNGLFGGISGTPAASMYQDTFNGCTGLTDELPIGVLGNLSGIPGLFSFYNTFNGCSNLTGKSVRNPNGKYLYNALYLVTGLQASNTYAGATKLEDYSSIPSAWK